MPSKYCLIFADPCEADVLIKRLQAARTADHYYSFADGKILISGWGSKHARSTLLAHAKECDLIWNAGFAGSFDPHPQIGTLFSIAKVGNHHNPPIQLADVGANLLTVALPIHDKSYRPPEWDLVDMEGYAIASTAQELGKKCRMWKIVSDFASLGGEALIQTHKQALSQQLATRIIDELNNDYESCSYP